MSNWPGKFVIGLTGNIATGKSVVRKMLEHLGAYGIDADALAHRAISRGAPGYKAVTDTFGKWILDADGQIDRGKLGRLVFNDPEALGRLENIVHPLVGQAVDVLAKRANQSVIVIEAIKLLESDLHSSCDSIWVTTAPQELQIARLVQKRGMDIQDARQRIAAQGSPQSKLSAAGVVIQNNGTFEEVWKQVVAAWKSISLVEPEPEPAAVQVAADEFYVQRGRPRDSQLIAELITRLSKGKKSLEADHVMEEFGDKAFMILGHGEIQVGIAGWQVENLVARTTDLFIDDAVPPAQAVGVLVDEVERASTELQCEASLVFLSADLARHETLWNKLGYERRTPQTLGIQAWQDAAIESAQPETHLFFKQLRKDRILRPI